MSRLRILGQTKLKRDAICPICKQIAQPANTVVEIIEDMDIQKQLASMKCKSCGEQILLG